MCAIAYISIYRKRPVNVLVCMLAIGMYWDLIVIGGEGGGGIGRVENLWLTSKLNSTVTMTVLITQDFFREYRKYSNERRTNCKKSNYLTYAPNKEQQSHFD